MAESLSRGQINDLMAGFATKNPEYRKALVSKPKEVLAAQLGQTLPQSMKVIVIEEKPDQFHVILPHVAKEGEELSDADLESVAGGYKDDYRCEIKQSGFGTRVEINASLY
ncbi:MAG: NHLP leader peptide family RiPP precursor [Acidobacteriota bacterium]